MKYPYLFMFTAVALMYIPSSFFESKRTAPSSYSTPFSKRFFYKGVPNYNLLLDLPNFISLQKKTDLMVLQPPATADNSLQTAVNYA